MEDNLSPSIDLQDVTVQKKFLPGRFSEVTVIGQGGMGVVLHAKDMILQREVAVKLLNFEGARSEELHERFLREAKALASLEHVNVVKILASGITDDGNPYHVLEYLEGEPLSAVLSRLSTLPVARFFNIIEQVCQGLIHAHGKNIVHRDIKPSNIFLTKDPDGRELVKVIDFGIARLLMPDQGTDSLSLTRSNLLLGSPAYMSPEQCNGSKVDHRSDIYSLGCLMYECLTGEHVFTASSGMEFMYKHMHEAPPKLEGKTQTESQLKLAQLLDLCLRKAPEERPESIAFIAAELEKISASDSEVKEFSLARRERLKKPMMVSVLLLSTFMVVCTLVVSHLLQSSHRQYAGQADKKFKPPAQELSKVNELKSRYYGLQKALDSKPKEAVRTEKLNSLVDTAVEISQLMNRSRKTVIDLLNQAANYCDENNEHDLLLKARLIERRADIEGAKSQELFEKGYQQAIELIHRATKGQVSDREIEARKNIIIYYLSNVDSDTTENFSKAKENYKRMEEIWNAKPIEKTGGGVDPAITISAQLVQQHGSFGILVDKPKLRFANCEFSLEVCDFMMRRGDCQKSGKLVGVILRALTDMKDDMPKGDKHFNEMAAHAHKLQAQLLRDEGELEAAKIHEDEAAALSR